MLISKKTTGKENSVKSQTFPGFNLKFSSSVLIISCKLTISSNLAQAKTFIRFCRNILSICFN